MLDPINYISRIFLIKALTEWNYYDTDRWFENKSECKGAVQSPINLEKNHSFGLELQPLIFSNYKHRFASDFIMENDGHTAKITLPKTQSGARPIISGGLLNGFYEALSVHFHWGSEGVRGSEHTVNGQHYDVEMHIVHKNKNYDSMEEATLYSDGLAVIAVMINIVDFPLILHPGLKTVFEQLDTIRIPGTRTTLHRKLTLDHFLGDIDRKLFYSYTGSLTTSPCSESVIWQVFPSPLYIQRKLIQNFFQLKQDNGAPLIDNFRPLQALNRRRVYRHTSGTYNS